MRIDAHQHFWKIGAHGHQWPREDLPILYRDFLPEDFDSTRVAAGVTVSILVQSQPNDEDTDWLLELSNATSSVAGVIGWVDIRAPEAPRRIAKLAEHPQFKGLRPMLQDLPADWILHPEAGRAIEAMIEHNLVFEALVRPRHLPALAQFARAHPNLRIIIDHAAKPDIARNVRHPWAADMAALAGSPNVWCKLSGLVTEAASDWSTGHLAFFADHVLTSFGPERVVWGSDWPVLLLASGYQRWIDATETLLSGFSADARAAILGGNAARLYALDSKID